MLDLKKIYNDILSYSIKSIFTLILKKYLIPIGMPLVTVILGLKFEHQLFYVWIGLILSLACTFLFLNQLNEWLYKRDVKNKISISGVELLRTPTSGYVIQLNFSNIAEYSIDLRTKITKFQIEDRVPSKDDLSVTVLIPAHGHAWRQTLPINFQDHALQKSIIYGSVEYEQEYGRHGKFNNKARGKIQLILSLDTKGHLQNWEWHNAKEEIKISETH